MLAELAKGNEASQEKAWHGDIFMLIKVSKFPLSLLSTIRNKFTHSGHQEATEGTRREASQKKLGNYSSQHTLWTPRGLKAAVLTATEHCGDEERGIFTDEKFKHATFCRGR